MKIGKTTYVIGNHYPETVNLYDNCVRFAIFSVVKITL